MVGDETDCRADAGTTQNHLCMVSGTCLNNKKLAGHLQLMLFARFQNRAGVSTANRIPPMVEWSSALMEEVWKSLA